MLEYERIDISKETDVVIFVIIDVLKILALTISLQWLSWFNAKSYKFL